MSTLAALKAGIVIAAFAAWPLVATAQPNQQNGTGQQAPPTGGQTQGTTPSQPPSGQAGPAGQEGLQQTGSPQSQGTESQRQAALQRLTAARQDLADITKLPAATRLEGQPRNDLNQLISNFNALITSTGPDWRQAYDRVQNGLTALLGPETEQGGQPPQSAPQSAVGTSGATPPPSLDPAIASKLQDMRQQIDQFGQTVGVKPGQSAVAQGQGASGEPHPGAAGTSGSASNEATLRNIDQIGSIVSRLLSSGTPDQTTISVSRQDLQQIQDYLNQLRQAMGQQQQPIK